MIDISEALAGDSHTPISGRRCKFGKLLDAVPPEQAAELTHRLAPESGWTDSRLAKLISSTAFGHINPSILSQHRTGACVCDTPTESQAA